MTIHKYQIKITDEQRVRMPITAQILTVQVQAGVPCLWAQVHEGNTKEDRFIEIFGTGHQMSGVERRYIGTIQMSGGTLVWHVFERL